MKKWKFYGLYIFLLIAAMVAGSWGFLVHKTVHQLAIYELPSDLRRFYYSKIDYMVYNAPRPDVRRNTDSTEATKHFIDLEVYGDSAAWKLPLKWEDAIKTVSKDTLLKYGYLPYQVMFMKEKLTTAFRLGNVDSILFYSADIGHYIADANVPLHTSVNYDGQLTNQTGLHSLWESMIPELEIGRYNLYSKHKARYLTNPDREIRKSIEKAYKLLPELFDNEKRVSLSFTDSQKYRVQTRRGKEYKGFTTEFAKAYAASLHNTINDQLISSADLIADFWYTCWIDGGRPDLENSLTKDDRKDIKRALKKELRSFRRNTLLSDSLLRAKQASVSPAE